MSNPSPFASPSSSSSSSPLQIPPPPPSSSPSPLSLITYRVVSISSPSSLTPDDLPSLLVKPIPRPSVPLPPTGMASILITQSKWIKFDREIKVGDVIVNVMKRPAGAKAQDAVPEWWRLYDKFIATLNNNNNNNNTENVSSTKNNNNKSNQNNKNKNPNNPNVKAQGNSKGNLKGNVNSNDRNQSNKENLNNFNNKNNSQNPNNPNNNNNINGKFPNFKTSNGAPPHPFSSSPQSSSSSPSPSLNPSSSSPFGSTPSANATPSSTNPPAVLAASRPPKRRFTPHSLFETTGFPSLIAATQQYILNSEHHNSTPSSSEILPSHRSLHSLVSLFRFWLFSVSPKISFDLCVNRCEKFGTETHVQNAMNEFRKISAKYQMEMKRKEEEEKEKSSSGDAPSPAPLNTLPSHQDFLYDISSLCREFLVDSTNPIWNKKTKFSSTARNADFNDDDDDGYLEHGPGGGDDYDDGEDQMDEDGEDDEKGGQWRRNEALDEEMADFIVN